jgi:hypothetical protein
VTLVSKDGKAIFASRPNLSADTSILTLWCNGLCESNQGAICSFLFGLLDHVHFADFTSSAASEPRRPAALDGSILYGSHPVTWSPVAMGADGVALNAHLIHLFSPATVTAASTAFDTDGVAAATGDCPSQGSVGISAGLFLARLGLLGFALVEYAADDPAGATVGTAGGSETGVRLGRLFGPGTASAGCVVVASNSRGARAAAQDCISALAPLVRAWSAAATI